ncbi:hypothetical protein [Candidatus Lokiarchaeum ossiferum]|uniref:hypothetical protein n=1 Tax=Candidatus Lokiarchaeum ossiferum TaxID=2951803 RepID=UPI00352C8517
MTEFVNSGGVRISEINASITQNKSLSAVCPFCFQSFKAISRHKCKIAPPNFTFQKEICNDQFFYYLYHSSVAFNKKSGHIDVVKLDRTHYQYSFIKLYLRLINNPQISFETAIIDGKFDDEKQIEEILAQKTELVAKKNDFAFSKGTKLVQLCPYCGLKFRRLSSHKCNDNPSFTFQCRIHPDEFFDLVYKASGIWDPRGFLNLYRFDLKRYRTNFLQAIKSLEETADPSVEVLEKLLVLPDEKVTSEPHKKTELEKIEDEISSNLKPTSHKSSNKTSSSDKSKIISKSFQKISDLKQICPFCFESFNSLYDHECDEKPPDIKFTLNLGEDYEFFKRLYREIGALNKYGKIDFNKFSHNKYNRLFTKYFQPPYLEEEKFKDYKQRILNERHKVAEEQKRLLEAKKRKNLQLQEKRAQKQKEDERQTLLKLQQLNQICPFCYKSTTNLVNHTCTKLPPDFSYSALLSQVTFFKDLYKNSNGLNRHGHIDQYRLNRRKYLQMFIRIHNRLQKSEDPNITLEYNETLDNPVVYDLTDYYSSLKQKAGKIEKIIEEKGIDVEKTTVPQICPYCYTLHECLFGHSCEHIPSGFKFDIQLFSAKFFEKIYQKIGCLSSKGILNFFIFDRSEYSSLFSYEYSQFLSGSGNQQSNDLEIVSSRTFEEINVPVEGVTEELPSRVPKEIVVEQKLNILDSLKVKNYRVKQICPYCYISEEDLSLHKCSKLPEDVSETFQFDIRACFSDFFLYLYYSINAWQRKGFVDENKLNRTEYTPLFFQLYNKLITQENPSLKETFESIYDDELAEQIAQKEIKSEFDDISEGSEQITPIKAKKKHYKFKHICPYCFQITDDLFAHDCQNLPSEIEEGFQFTEIPYADDFFESLYSQTSALNRFGKLDQYRLNRSKYTTLFLSEYNKKQEKSALEAKNSTIGDKIELKSESSIIEELNIEVDDEYSDMDLLELLSRDIDIGSDSQPSVKSSPKIMHESSDGMPLCFSCKNMVDCPKGLDSSQMESCMKCDEYDTMSGSSSGDADSEEESGMPLCFSCSNMIDCPRGIDSDQMETIFSCKEFRDMNAPEEIPEEKPPLCFSCSNMVNCPRGIDSAQMENIFDCKYYQDMNSNTPSPNITTESSLKSSSETDFSQNIDETSSEEDLLSTILSRRNEDKEAEEKRKLQQEEEKQRRIAEIMKEWEKSKGELKVFCKKCEAEMTKVVTQKKVYYQCSNYPECLIRGDEWYVKKATEKKVVTQKIQGDLIKIYQFDATINVVFISEIYSEGKLFL